MEDHLYISIPITIKDTNDVEAMKKFIAMVIEDNQNSFLPLLERLIDLGDSRVTVIDNSLNVEDCDIDLSLADGIACATFDSDFYAGCKDMNSQNDHEVALPFTIENNNIVFDIEIPPAWRPGENE